ncbi:MAG: hypothetical protein LBP63_10475 [Prevotellaceae bacterium]|jgi:hypothetical protein|nr:hypothetical protein [Prevotellaceae bacterium]
MANERKTERNPVIQAANGQIRLYKIVIDIMTIKCRTKKEANQTNIEIWQNNNYQQFQ